MNTELDQIAPLLAKLLAPHMAAELGLALPGAHPALSPDYDERTAQLFASGLGDAVLPRAELLFGWLGTLTHDEVGDGGPKSITSPRLTKLLGLGSPRQIAAALTNSLKKRATKLGLPNPWIQEETPDGRTLWRCRDADEADRLLSAVQAELKRRGLPTRLSE